MKIKLMPTLLCFVTNYNILGALYDESLSADKRLTKIVKLKLPYPVFSPNYSDVWESVYNELLLRFDLKVPVKTIVVCHSLGFWFDHIKGKNLKKIPAEKAFTEFNIPVVYLGEDRFYSMGGALEFNIDSRQVFKWFDFEESTQNVENFLANSFLYGNFPADSVWEKSFENALLREKMQFAFKNSALDFLDTVEEIYLSGEFLYKYEDTQELLLNFLNSVNITGFWHLYFDKHDVLGFLVGLYGEKKENVLEFLDEYKFKHIADVFVVPSVSSARVSFEDGKEQVLDLSYEGVYLIPSIKEEDVGIKLKLKKRVFEKTLSKSEFGIVFDTRKRPLVFSDSRNERFTLRDSLRKQLGGWKMDEGSSSESN
ncbi:MAG: hypothetical protein ABIB98_00560 [bacterium]